MSNFEVEVPSSFDCRSFLATASGAIFNFMIVPRHVLGGAGFIAPSEMLNIAGIGPWHGWWRYCHHRTPGS